MRKLLTFFAATLITGSLLAGGLVTNTNQSAMFTRLQNRNASTSIDAAYFNPAGVTKLGDGFFVSINNQTITQTQTVISTNQFLAGQPKKYVGNVSAPIFPGVYVAYNRGRFSLSAGFNPIGGGGGAEYKTGLPSFEMMVANIVPSLNLANPTIPTSAYSADIYFKGSSVYFGYQVNVGYKINDMLSVAAGVRLVTATNKYSGYLKNISINPNYPNFGPNYTGGMVLASQFFTDGQTYLNTVSTQLSGTAASLQPIITGGGGDVLLSNGTAAGLTAIQVATLQGTITALGGSPSLMTIKQSQAFFSGASATFGTNAGLLGNNATATQDKNVKASESGRGITPIISANFSPSDNLNIAVRYEFKTELDLKTKVGNNLGGGVFVDGTKVVADMPAMLAVGVDYKPIDKLTLSLGFTTYFDKNNDYDGDETRTVDEIDKNFFEYGLGVEYSLTDKLRISGGWTHTDTGANLNYQGDQRFSTNTNSVGGGFGYRISPMIDLNIGGQYAFYKDGSKSFQDVTLNTYTETYKKSTWMIAVGLDFSFGKK